MQVIQKIEVKTVNRGVQTFTVSQNSKGFFAHELGELTQWAKAFNTGEQKAHRLNPTKVVGNQYGSWWKPKPFQYVNEAFQAIHNQANTNVQYF
jgi:hypothetical protein